MKRTFYYILAFLMLSCSMLQKEEGLPEGVLDEERLTALLVDLELAEAMIELTLVSRHSNEKKQALLNEVFQTHQTTKENFKKSYDYYLQHPKEFQLIYEEVSARIKEKQAKFELDTKETDTREERIKAKKIKTKNPFIRRPT